MDVSSSNFIVFIDNFAHLGLEHSVVASDLNKSEVALRADGVPGS